MPLSVRISSPQDIFELLTAALVLCCLLALVLAVVSNFATATHEERESRVRRSPVATGSMTAVLTTIGLLIGKRLDAVALPSLLWQDALMIVGLLLLVGGTVVNLLGRVQLGRNWANQATVYADQTLVTTGVFALVRHPLYASLIWMSCGGALIYRNVAALLATLCVFVPMMIYRAGIEEEMLSAQFTEYAEYCRKVGRLMPRWHTLSYDRPSPPAPLPEERGAG